MSIKPIETRYNGHRFRSRLEARWAVFFDHLPIVYNYEPEGFQLPSGPYLPDFALPRISGNGLATNGVYVEIKPKWPSEREATLAYELAVHSGMDVFVFAGVPKVSINALSRVVPHYATIGYLHDKHGGHWDGVNELYDHGHTLLPGGLGTWYIWSKCPDCGCVGLVWCAQHLACGGCSQGHSAITTEDEPSLLRAYDAAMSARFEHGEEGAG